MTDDVVARAKAAMEKYPRMGSQYEDDRFIGIMRGLVPELVAEIERLRSEHNRELLEAFQSGYNERGRYA